MSAAKYFALSEYNRYACGKPRALAERIDYMIEHPEFRKELSEKYVEYGERFRIDKCIDKMEEMFRDAVNGVHKT